MTHYMDTPWRLTTGAGGILHVKVDTSYAKNGVMEAVFDLRNVQPEPEPAEDPAASWFDRASVIRDLPSLIAEKIISRDEARDALKRFGVLR